MPDVQEVFHSATQKASSASGALERQHHAQQRRASRQKLKVYVVVGVLIAAIALLIVAAPSLPFSDREKPAHRPTPTLPTRRILFLGISAIDADGSGLTNQLSPTTGSTPAWSPDGRRIVYAEGDVVNDSSKGLFVMNADGSGATRLTTGEDYLPDWSPDGSRIAFIRYSKAGGGNIPGSSEVWIINVDGSGLRQVTDVRGSIRPTPSWSPDGQQIAFSGGLNGFIYIINANGTGLTHKGVLPRHAWDPQWSPDGSRILYDGWDSAGWGIFTVAPDGSDSRRLNDFDPGKFPRPVWSPDGSWIAFATHDHAPSTGIWVMDANGGHLTEIIKRPDAYQPNW